MAGQQARRVREAARGNGPVVRPQPRLGPTSPNRVPAAHERQHRLWEAVVVTDERNVLGGELEPCGIDPVTGFYRDGLCATGPEDLGRHVICAVVTADFLSHQRQIGNDLTTARPEFRFPGLVPGDRWCVVAERWRQALEDGRAAPVVLAATHERALEIIPLDALRRYAVDVPPDLSSLD